MKRLHKAEFSYENCYIRFQSASEQNPKHYLVAPANDKWENIRYCLEKSVGCFKFTLPQKVMQNSYFTAHYEFSVVGVPPGPGSVLTSKTQVYGGDILVLTRHPQPPYMHAYIPPKYWNDLGDYDPTTGMEEYLQQEATASGLQTQTQPQTQADAVKKNNEYNEEQLLQRLLSQVSDTSFTVALPVIAIRMLRQHILHPSDYPTLCTPHPLFICKYCNTQGKHFQQLCPFIETNGHNNTQELVTKVRRIVGIPKSRLRAATEEEVALGQYYLSENNEKVVVLKKEHELAVEKIQTVKEPKALVVRELTADDLWAMRDQEEYEQSFEFSFESYILEQDVLEEERDNAFYATHLELKKKKNQICTHYYRGMCHKGKLECEFLHTGDVNYIAICQFFVNGQCTMGDNCEFRHPPKHLFNNECNAYNRGFCDKGPTCKYKHVKYRQPNANTELAPADVSLMDLSLLPILKTVKGVKELSRRCRAQK
jgi:hypothetical protein